MTLIERLEAASGPDRELDEAIYIMLIEEGFKPERGQPGYPTFAYTASLDAAMTLVPEGSWDHMEVYRPDFQALCWTVHLLPNGNFNDAKPSEGFGQSWPLALCIASLKARGVS